MRPWWMIGATCASLALPAGAAGQAGVLVRGLSDLAHCSPGGEHTSIDGSCAELTCDVGRVCVTLDGVGARCIDPSRELVCAPGTDCEACPLNQTTGADPEGCRAVELPEGRHVVCIYSTRLACLLEDGIDLDPLACLPAAENEPSLAAGDCDADGVANDEDTCLCESGTGPSCGVLPLDGGASDAGASDAGRADAAPPADASARDASRASPSISFRGGGGCACGAAGGRPGGGMASALALAWVLRRRRRAPRPCA